MMTVSIIVQTFSDFNTTQSLEKCKLITPFISFAANKRQITEAVKKLYDVDALRVNTLIRCVS